jgi:hypothetical protein
MSRLYGARQRAYQDQFDTRRIADKIEALAIQPQLSEMDIAFVQSRDMFWLSTIDEQGRPTVSYKGGDPGFVRVVDDKTLVFPLYDGNGMYYSAGNIAGISKVGLLFTFPEAQMVVRVAVTEVWPNCPRYVHRYQKVQASRYVPRTECKTPLAGWKRIDMIQDDLPGKDQGRASKEGGLISIEEWFGKVATGDPEA